MNWRGTLESLAITLAALVLSMVLFAVFVLLIHKQPPQYMVTDKTLASLRGQGVPEEVLGKLDKSEVKNFPCTGGREQLADGLEGVLTDKELADWKEKILDLSLEQKRVWPVELYTTIYNGSFGDRTAWMDTLKRAAPLILTALCTALPARLGLIIIGGEGALILGGLVAAVIALPFGGLPWPVPQVAMLLSAMLVGGALIGGVGALQYWRGVNATIVSLLVYYIAKALFSYLVETLPPYGFKDPLSLNKFSTPPISENAYVGDMPFLQQLCHLDVHWGLLIGIVICLLMYVLMDHTTFGFAVRMAGGNVRAAQASGLPVGWLILVTCSLGGAFAGLAGGFQVAAAEHQANAGLYAQKYGFTGILIAFIARHQPLAIIPTAIVFGGLKASSDALQTHFKLPDASVDVLAGTAVVLVLTFETLYGRFRVFQSGEKKRVEPAASKPVAPEKSMVPA